MMKLGFPKMCLKILWSLLITSDPWLSIYTSDNILKLSEFLHPTINMRPAVRKLSVLHSVSTSFYSAYITRVSTQCSYNNRTLIGNRRLDVKSTSHRGRISTVICHQKWPKHHKRVYL